MVGKLLVRGMLAGIVAGLLAFGFAKIVGEPQVDQAISYEEKNDAAKSEPHTHEQGEPHEHELVSRDTQAGIGLFTGVMIFGAAVGGLFSLVFAYAYGRVRLPARQLSAWLAMAAFIALVITPNIKYPANPPSVGDPATIGYRTGLFFLMIAISVVVMVFSTKVRQALRNRLGAWNASIVAGLVFIAIIAAIQLALPSVNEVPPDFPATLLWNFRSAAIGMQAILWATIGLLFGAMVENGERRSSRA